MGYREIETYAFAHRNELQMFRNASEIFSLFRVERVASLQIDDIIGIRWTNGRIDESIVHEIANDLENLAIRSIRKLELEASPQHFGNVA